MLVTVIIPCFNEKKTIAKVVDRINNLKDLNLEVILNQELGEPFRRDAMKKPVKVAGINKADMVKQPSLNS